MLVGRSQVPGDLKAGAMFIRCTKKSYASLLGLSFLGIFGHIFCASKKQLEG